MTEIGRYNANKLDGWPNSMLNKLKSRERNRRKRKKEKIRRHTLKKELDEEQR